MDYKATRRTKGKYTKGRVAAVPPAVRAYVARAIDRQTEEKQIMWSLLTQFPAVSTTWSELYVTQMVQGAAEYQRTGCRVRVKEIELSGVLACGASQAALDDPWNVFRLCLGFYTGTTSATGPLGEATALSMDSPLDQHTKGKLKMKLIDRYIPLNITSTEKGEGDGYTPHLVGVKYHKRFPRGVLINWQGNDATIPTTALWMSCLSDSTALPNPGFVAGYLKVTYEDA